MRRRSGWNCLMIRNDWRAVVDLLLIEIPIKCKVALTSSLEMAE
jgi:hypothetical protein